MSENHPQRQNKDQDQKQRVTEGQNTDQQDQDQELNDASLDEVTGGTTAAVTEEFPFLVVKNR